MAAAGVGEDHGTLYHLVQSSIWNTDKSENKAYYPPTYDADGFIHLTKEARLLLDVANHFYKEIQGEFLVLAIDSKALTSKVVFEAAAPVGDRKAYDEAAQQLFPHLYGSIDFSAVTAELPVQRSEDGTFLAIPGLPAQ
eukprot:gene6071-6310_t